MYRRTGGRSLATDRRSKSGHPVIHDHFDELIRLVHRGTRTDQRSMAAHQQHQSPSNVHGKQWHQDRSHKAPHDESRLIRPWRQRLSHVGPNQKLRDQTGQGRIHSRRPSPQARFQFVPRGLLVSGATSGCRKIARKLLNTVRLNGPQTASQVAIVESELKGSH